MALIRLNPFRDFNVLNDRLGSFLGKGWDAPASTTTWNPSVDIFENDSDVVIKAELPGLNAKDIDIKLENNVLTIRGERHFEKEAKEENYHRIEREYGSFSRSFSLPLTVDGDKVDPNTPPITGAEDFAFMLEKKPGAYIMIGNGGDKEGGCHYVHSPLYDFNDAILTTGAAYWVNLVQLELGDDA